MTISLTIPNLIFGAIGIGLGIWVTYSAYHINHHILFAGWIENKYGPGSGTTFYRFLGAGICIFSIFVFLGIIDLFGSAFGSVSPEIDQSNMQAPNFFPLDSTPGGRIAD